MLFLLLPFLFLSSNFIEAMNNTANQQENPGSFGRFDIPITPGTARYDHLQSIKNSVMSGHGRAINAVLANINSIRNRQNCTPAMLLQAVPGLNYEMAQQALNFVETGGPFNPEMIMHKFGTFFPQQQNVSRYASFIGFVKVLEIIHSVNLEHFLILGLENITLGVL